MKWLVWDFDGTLAYRVGGWPAWTQALIEVLDRETPGHGADPELLRPFLRTGFPWHSPEAHHPHLASADAWWGALEPRFADAFRAVGADEAGASKMAKDVRRAYLAPERWRLYEDAVPALEELSSSGWRHALLTNHVPELPEIAGSLGLGRHLDLIFNSAQSGYEKPHPQAFRGVLEAVGGPRRSGWSATTPTPTLPARRPPAYPPYSCASAERASSPTLRASKGSRRPSRGVG